METLRHINISKTDIIGCENCWFNNITSSQNCMDDCVVNGSINNEILEFKKGATLIKNGEAVSGIYCVKSGFVRVTKNGKGNKEFIVWIAGKGDIIGLNSFVSDNVYSFSATAVDKTSACFIPIAELKKRIDKDPALIVLLMKRLCEKLNFVEHRITSLSGKSIREQCAEILISIAIENGGLNDKSLYINYSIKDIANLIGTTRNYLYKILLEFTDRKILIFRNKKIVINDLNKLSLIANGNDKLI